MDSVQPNIFHRVYFLGVKGKSEARLESFGWWWFRFGRFFLEVAHFSHRVFFPQGFAMSMSLRKKISEKIDETTITKNLFLG